TGDEIAAFLGARRSVVLGTLRPDGHPDAAIVPARYADGVLSLSVGDDVREAIGADDRVCCAAEMCPSYYEIKGVSAHGRATVTGDGSVRVPVDEVTSFDFAKIRERLE